MFALLGLVVVGVGVGVVFFRSRSGGEVSVSCQKTENNVAILKYCSILEEPYRAPFWANKHVQSLLMAVLRPAPILEYKREYINAEDGELIAIDKYYSPHASGNAPPVVLVIPGIAGGADTAYVRQLVKLCGEQGWHSLVLNHRGCNSTKLSRPRLFRLGDYSDFRCLVEHAKKIHPDSPLFGVGYSMGGNILVNYLGVYKDSTYLNGAISVCQGYNISKGFHWFSNNRPFYNFAITKKLTSLVTKHQSLFKDRVDVPEVVKATNLTDFEVNFTCKLYGYQNTEEYFEEQSSHKHLPNVPENCPLLLLNALDDPLIPHSVLPHEIWKSKPNVILVLTEYGGHLGFAEGKIKPNPFAWSDRLCVQFFTGVLNTKHTSS